jgi:phosphoglycerate dehydrogenase-like enzyme
MYDLTFYDNSDLSPSISRVINKKFYTCFNNVGSPKNADIVLCGVKPYKGTINNRYIAAPLTNVDHIVFPRQSIVYLWDTKALRNVTSTAEHTLHLMLSLVRNDRLHPGLERPRQPYNTLKGKTLGLIGFGRIGNQVMKLSRAFGVHVIWYDPKWKTDSLEDVIKKSDIVSVHASVTPGMKPILGGNELQLIKDGAYLINTSRGGAIDYDYLYKTRKRFGGIALDVFPNNKTHRRFKRISHNTNIICTNHISGYTHEDLTRTSELVFGYLQEKLMEQGFLRQKFGGYDELRNEE